MTARAFCEDCSWTTTAGSVDVAGDGGRHAGTRNHVVRQVLDDLADRMYVGDWRRAAEAECGKEGNQ